MTDKSKPKFRRRKAKVHDTSIVSRDELLAIIKKHGKPMTHLQLSKSLGYIGDNYEDEQLGVERRLTAMVRDGQLAMNRRGAYGLIDKMNLKQGKVFVNKNGGGKVETDSGSYSLAPIQLRKVFHGDVVQIYPAETYPSSAFENDGPAARITDILQKNTTTVIGECISHVDGYVVKTENVRPAHWVWLEEKPSADLVGEKVVVTITDYPTTKEPAKGNISHKLPSVSDPSSAFEWARFAKGLPVDWPETAIQESEALPIKIRPKDKRDREDLRALPFVTIDGEDSKDFDDAVYCEKNKKDWRLCVAIADVSHYVKPDSGLDLEAYNRGNSVYFPNAVVPMLPEKLSNGLCSLNPNVERLVLVCDMKVKSNGQVSRYQFYPAIIKSHARLTYSQVSRWLGEEAITVDNQDLQEPIENLYGVYQALLQSRISRGALEFDTPEVKMNFRPDGHIQAIYTTIRTDAHRLIEECMLAANVSAADFLIKNHYPALYRVHEAPSGDKLNDLRQFLGEFGLVLPNAKEPSAKDFAKLSDAIKKQESRLLIEQVVLRSMMQARYSSNNNGHFGLNYEHYTHFTSPIRRYSDLLVHRAIKHILIFKQNNPRKKVYNKKEQLEKQQDLELVGQHLSNTERRADEATREVANWLKCAYLEDRVGDVFTGSISQVTSFGLFIALKDLYIEGLVHISALDNDYYHFDSIRHCLIGERTRQMYRLGQPIVVRLSRVVLEQKMIDFELVEVLPSSGLKNEKLGSEINSKYKSKTKPKSKSKSKAKSKDKTKGKAKTKHKSRRKSF